MKQIIWKNAVGRFIDICLATLGAGLIILAIIMLLGLIPYYPKICISEY